MDLNIFKAESYFCRSFKCLLSLLLFFVMLFGITAEIDFSAFAENNNSNKIVYLGDNRLVENDNAEIICKFTPKQSGAYKFKVLNGWMSVDNLKESFGYNHFYDNSANEQHSVYYLKSGITYYIKCSGVVLSINKLMNVKGIDVLNPQINGFFDCQLYPFKDLEIKITLENNTETIVKLKDLNCHYDSSYVVFYDNNLEFLCSGLMRKNTDNIIKINCNTIEASFNVNVEKYVTKAVLVKNAENEYFKNGEVMLGFSDGSSILFKNDAEKVNFGGWGGVDEYLVSYPMLLRSRSGLEFYSDCVYNFYNKNAEPLTFLPSDNINNRIYIGKDWKVFFDFKILIHFNDLVNFELYNQYVIYTSVYNKFISGTNPPKYTEFSPQKPITRAMFAAILYRMAGNPYDGVNPHTSNPFSDVNENAYYYNAACWALDEGITNQLTFRPNDNVTREQTARFLFAYAEANNLLGSEEYKSVKLSKYPDYNSVHDWAKEPLQWANYNNMITGTQQGYINPQGATQRIHATRILYGFGKVCNIGKFS